MARPHDPTSIHAGLYRQRLLIVVLLVLAGILAMAMAGAVPLAGAALGLLLLVLAVSRLLLSPSLLGAVAVRSRVIDALFLTAVGVGLIVLASSPNL